MRKVNKVVHSDPNVEELLLSLQIENESFEEDQESEEASEDSHASSDEIEYRIIGESGSSGFSATDFSAKVLKEKGEYNISKGPLPFSLFEIVGNKGRTESTVITSQKFSIGGGRYDYGFTPSDLKRYRIKRKKKTKEVCPNWEDISEEKRNEPKRICVRSLRLKSRK
ncbi:hypothetical protein EHEL_041630 [Encephalitozoon hellem ATCC 50504]|uniref:uncharacterized protein n=1 Tax=Encephalitozoon hellem (strain ATCC 50504) TaxID=907965 RepID=UPI000269DB73|nr:uncharacterized protein EHEL_041630 [Encephalitozoon hellem ATCC 50504]AFM98211.1 hypothetical protein EHEL_041630 [Encephalitozoon hellem ATCC 50504]|eukprot:XP_003887192.1 hypothetical protein EHEL_041630 [Encephalitozoon hellem ATCC 50504]